MSRRCIARAAAMHPSRTGRRVVSRPTATTATSRPSVRRRITANFLKAFLLVALLVAIATGFGWLIGGTRSAGLFAFCGLSAAIAVYWLGERALLGMLAARPFA